jgi:hypothetical protein
MLQVGTRGRYDWLVSEYQIDDLLRTCPETVLNKYLAITSFDSGPLSLSENEKAAGWQSRGSIAYSPRVTTVHDLPHDLFDEWYVLEAPVDLGGLLSPAKNPFEASLQKGLVCPFVNFGGFSLSRPAMKDPADMLWQQLEWIRPESYIADGDYLNFVSSNRDIFGAVQKALRALE